MGSSGSKRLCKVLGVHHLSQLQVLSTSDIDRIWKDYDSDHNELLEGEEVTSFLKDFAGALGIKYSKKLAIDILQSINETSSSIDLRHCRLDFAAFHRLLISLYAKAESKSSLSEARHPSPAVHPRLLLSSSVRASGLEACRGGLAAEIDDSDPSEDSLEGQPACSSSLANSPSPSVSSSGDAPAKGGSAIQGSGIGAEDIFTLSEARALAAEYRAPKWSLGQATSAELTRFFAFLRKLLRTVAVLGIMMPKELCISSSSMPSIASKSMPAVPITSQSFDSLNHLVLDMASLGLIYIYDQYTDEATGIRKTHFPLSELMETIVHPGVPVAASLAAYLYQTIISKPDHNDIYSLSPRFFDILSRNAPMSTNEDPSLLQIILRNILDAVTPNRPSAKFWSTGFLDLNDDISRPADPGQLAHPFYAVFPRPSNYRSLYFYRVLGSPAPVGIRSSSSSSSAGSSPQPSHLVPAGGIPPLEIIVVYTSPKRDELLWNFRSAVLESFRNSTAGGEEKRSLSLPNTERETLLRISRVAEAVIFRLPLPDIPWPQHLQQLHDRYQSNLIPLGGMTHGLPRHRAILFKYLCDLLELPCQLCRPRRTALLEASFNIWNVAFDGIRSWVVNFSGSAARMMPYNSAEAVEYTSTPMYAATAADDLHLWLSKWKCGEEKMLKHLGSGAFGAVESVEITVSGMAPRVIARKTLKPGKASIIRAIWLEAQALLFLEHPNILTFYCASIDFEQCKAIFYTELCDGSLSDILKKPELRDQVSVVRWSQLLLGVIGALAYMHSHSFVHRDIKPGNILLRLSPNPSASNHITSLKLADFGLARNFRYTKLNSLAGTPGWRPPEVVAKTTQLMPERADIYSFGLLFALCLLNQGSSPWGSLRVKKPDGTMGVRSDADSIPYSYIMRHLQPDGQLGFLPHDFVRFLHGCLHADVNERLSATAAVAQLQLLIVCMPPIQTQHNLSRGSSSAISRAPSSPFIPP